MASNTATATGEFSDQTGSPSTSIHSEKVSPFGCTICKRSYSRIDHLARHYRSHTHEKPFVCATCNKGFSRADLLKRHSAAHNDSRGVRKTDSATRPVSRVAHACISCASAKLRCGHQRPCNRCQQKSIACEFPGSGEKFGNPSITEMTESSNSMLDVATRSASSVHSDSGNSFNNLGQQNSSFSSRWPRHLDYLRSYEDELGASSSLVEDCVLEDDDISLADFLREIIMPSSHGVFSTQNNTGVTLSTLGRDAFGFGIDSSIEFDEIDFGWIEAQNFRQVPTVAWESSIASEQQPARVKATPDISRGFSKSVWRRWKPVKQKHAFVEQVYLSLPRKDVQILETQQAPRILKHRLTQKCRDEVLAMALANAETTNESQILASFPPVEVLDLLMQGFFLLEHHKIDSWIHLPTFDPSNFGPELDGMLIAAGAVLSPISTVRKLGFAIQEVVRMEIPRICDKDNSRTRSLEIAQACALELSVGLFSANVRKIEITMSQFPVLVTMLRSPGHYQRQANPAVALRVTDDGETLKTTWLQWVEAESFKRLSIHSMIHDAQASWSLASTPSIALAELSLEVPFSRDLWRARDEYEWRDIWLSKQPHISQRLPSFLSCVHDLELLKGVEGFIDVELTMIAIIHSTWSVISDYRRLDVVFKTKLREGSEDTEPWKRDISRLLSQFGTYGVSQESFIIRELFSMSLFVSQEDLHTFAGRRGLEEAHRVYPILKKWYSSRTARQAIAHAGQVIRAANTAPFNRLRDFYAAGLYHCALCLWVYGVCAIGSGEAGPDGLYPNEKVWLDSEQTAEMQRFVQTGRGTPWIKGIDQTDGHSLFNPKEIMDTVLFSMENCCSGGLGFVPPIVENLGIVMKDLGSAAWIVSSQSLRSTLPLPVLA